MLVQLVRCSRTTLAVMVTMERLAHQMQVQMYLKITSEEMEVEVVPLTAHLEVPLVHQQEENMVHLEVHLAHQVKRLMVHLEVHLVHPEVHLAHQVERLTAHLEVHLAGKQEPQADQVHLADQEPQAD